MQFNPAVNFWLKNQPRTYINKLTDTDTSWLRFDLGESSLVNAAAAQTLKLLTKNSLSHNGDPTLAKLKQAIASDQQLSPENISPCEGCDELIETLPRLLLSPGDKALLVTPSFFRFHDAVNRQGAKIIFSPTRLENDFQFTSATATNIINLTRKQQVKLIWLCHPNNPTGLPIPINLIKQIVKASGSFVVIDEAFGRFLSPSLNRLTTQIVIHNQNTLILRSLSKADGLAGLKIGWAIGHPATIKLLEAWRLPFNIPLICQEIAVAALKTSTLHLHQVRRVFRQERVFFESVMQSKPNFQLISGSRCNIVLIRHLQLDLFTILKKKKILVSDLRTTKGLESLNFVRITLQPNRSQNKQLLSVLKAL